MTLMPSAMAAKIVNSVAIKRCPCSCASSYESTVRICVTGTAGSTRVSAARTDAASARGSPLARTTNDMRIRKPSRTLGNNHSFVSQPTLGR